MRDTANGPSDQASWEVARPERAGLVPGVDMAGFRIAGALSGGLRIVPHPAVTLFLDLGESRSHVDDGQGQRCRGSLVTGPGFGSGGSARAWGERAECLQVRLSPVVARAVLGAGPAELAGTMVGLDALWGRDAARIHEQLSELASWQERFARVQSLLARRAASHAPVDPEVAWAWQRIASRHGRVRVEGLAAELGWSRKRLWSRFQAQLGMAPKHAVRLARFDRSAHRLVAGVGAARVAADGGYFDQSHLHRDIRTFTGLTPADVAAEPFLTVDDRAWPSAGRLLTAHGAGLPDPAHEAGRLDAGRGAGRLDPAHEARGLDAGRGAGRPDPAHEARGLDAGRGAGLPGTVDRRLAEGRTAGRPGAAHRAGPRTAVPERGGPVRS